MDEKEAQLWRGDIWEFGDGEVAQFIFESFPF